MVGTPEMTEQKRRRMQEAFARVGAIDRTDELAKLSKEFAFYFGEKTFEEVELASIC